MSYDLYFTKPPITRAEFTEYFGRRAHYKLENNQAWYGNEDTGVYFSFEFFESDGSPPEDPEAPIFNVSFNINFYRPHVFALEAEPEIRSFVDHFQASVFDTQNDGMGDSEVYQSEAFLRGWNAGNEFAYRTMSEQSPAPVHTRPITELEAIWNWNYNREQVQNKFGEDLFVPRIIFVIFKSALCSVAVWPDAISTLLPFVDLLFIPRKETAPRRLFGKSEDICCIPFSQADPVLRPYQTGGYALPTILLPPPKTPDSVVSFVKSLTPAGKELTGVSMDQVLNREILEKYR